MTDNGEVARLLDRHPANAAGDWYVDTRCIDCGACRQLAPETFTQGREQSLVVAQPGSDEAYLAAWRASVACPTQSIGTQSRPPRPEGLFPQELGEGVYYCGFNSEHSFGANAFLVCRPSGNFLVDSPRWSRRLAGPITALGGIDDVLLTHRDDVADAERWATEFGARVWVHEDDAGAAPFATHLLHGSGDTEIRPGLVAVPLPGHTKGSVAFLLDERYLFSGDSLAWDAERNDLVAFRHACWYSWTEQTASLGRLAAHHRFSWVLAGHGGRHQADDAEMHRRLTQLVERMARR
ncbi:MAG: hypothetical protein QOJ52_3328 [Acidimicrobiaceae bacterium]|jgi:glyoxylase-like metal-dependent hydrolase (beta-lactamase superfamily II)/ferredoxin|nr:hypothetical protein [Acidimicrobiaceae bacterium]MDQ1443432.1 hypothetical protein [Acidimicrobiaceae bacterium]